MTRGTAGRGVNDFDAADGEGNTIASEVGEVALIDLGSDVLIPE